MELTVLGGAGAWPTAGQGCSGYLVEHAGFRLLLDPGYGVLGELARWAAPAQLDAVLVTHGHPDHCADLNPLLRARTLGVERPAAPLPLYAPPGELDAVLRLDRPGLLEPAYALREFTPGDAFPLGPLHATTRLLPHARPNAGVRLTAADGTVLAFTGDTGPSLEVPRLAAGAHLFLCEATHLTAVPPTDAGELLTARHAGRYAAEAVVHHLLLTHLWPGTDPTAAARTAGEEYLGPIDVAVPGVRIGVWGR